jgi:Type IIA topoisomerase (DNA gyrase/topo II, topoisomerase IV), A subunit
VQELRSQLDAEKKRSDELEEELDDREKEVADLRRNLSDRDKELEQLRSELSELKQKSAATASKDLPEAADLYNQLKTKRKKSTATLADVEAILEMIEES